MTDRESSNTFSERERQSIGLKEPQAAEGQRRFSQKVVLNVHDYVSREANMCSTRIKADFLLEIYR